MNTRRVGVAKPILFSFLSLSILASSALATPIHKHDLETSSQDITVPLSPSAVEVETQNDEIQREKSERREGKLELGVSSWQPKSLNPATVVSNPSAFTQLSLPALEVNFLQPMGKIFNLKIGAGFASFSRTAVITGAGVVSQGEQAAYIPSARVGVEYEPVIGFISGSIYHPYLAASLLPSMVITNRSPLDNGKADLGLLGEAEAGVLVSITKSLQLNVEVSEVLGKIQNSDLSGFGFQTGLRMPL